MACLGLAGTLFGDAALVLLACAAIGTYASAHCRHERVCTVNATLKAGMNHTGMHVQHVSKVCHVATVQPAGASTTHTVHAAETLAALCLLLSAMSHQHVHVSMCAGVEVWVLAQPGQKGIAAGIPEEAQQLLRHGKTPVAGALQVSSSTIGCWVDSQHLC